MAEQLAQVSPAGGTVIGPRETLSLGPGFRLAARWNRAVETVTTRKTTAKDGGRMGEMRSKMCEGVGIT